MSILAGVFVSVFLFLFTGLCCLCPLSDFITYHSSKVLQWHLQRHSSKYINEWSHGHDRQSSLSIREDSNSTANLMPIGQWRGLPPIPTGRGTFWAHWSVCVSLPLGLEWKRVKVIKWDEGKFGIYPLREQARPPALRGSCWQYVMLRPCSYFWPRCHLKAPGEKQSELSQATFPTKMRFVCVCVQSGVFLPPSPVLRSLKDLEKVSCNLRVKQGRSGVEPRNPNLGV